MMPQMSDRIARLRSLAIDRNLEGALVFSWRRRSLSWFCGYDPGYATNTAALWVPASGEPSAWVRFPFERERIGKQTGLEVVPTIDVTSFIPGNVSRIGLVAGDLAVDEWSVARMGRKLECQDLSAEVDAWRAVKSAEDIEAARHAAQMADEALSAVQSMVRPGVTDFQLVSATESFARERGALRTLCMIGVGDGAVGSEARGVVLNSGDPVTLELNIWTQQGCTHVNATMHVDRPRTYQREAERACRRVRSMLVDAMRPGLRVSDLVELGDQALDDVGSLRKFKEYDFGHGVGLDLPELPKLLPDSSSVLGVGNVIAVHVAVREPNGRTAFIGGPIEMTDSGADELVPSRWWTGSSLT